MADENNQAAPDSGGNDWTTDLDADIRTAVQTKGYKSPGDLAKAYFSLEKTIGADKVALPAKDAQGNRDWSAWDGWNALGRPESADKYDVADVKLPDGVILDENAKKGFFAEAHKHGLTNAQAKALLGWYGNFTAEAMQGMNGMAEKQAAEAVAALKQEWGQAFDSKMDLANRAIRQFGGKDLAEALEKNGLGRDPAMVKAFAAIGAALGEDGELPDGKGGKKSAAAVLSPAEANAEINRIYGEAMSDPKHPYNDQRHPEHETVNKRLLDLFAMANPDSQAA